MANTLKKGFKISYRQTFFSLFSSSALLIFGTCFLIENGGMTYDAVLAALLKVVPFSIILGGLGWFIGLMIDNARIRQSKKFQKSIIDDLLEMEEAVENLNLNIDDNMDIDEALPPEIEKGAPGLPTEIETEP